MPRLARTLATLVCLTAPAPALRAQALSLPAVDSAVRREMTRQRIPGVAVAVVRRGETIVAKGYGRANLEHDVPVTAESMFESGSLGKMFTAAGVMTLVEEGRLQLDAPVRTYLPDAPAAWQSMTLRHLLSHTSGIPDYTGDQMDYRRDYADDDLLRLAYALPLEFAPGRRWNYSNTGYIVLGVIVHKVAGKPYWELLRERVFGPARMPTARVISEAAVVPHRVAGYLPDSGGWRNQDWVSPTLNTTADGSLLISLRDMIAWHDVVRKRAVLGAASWAAMQSPVRLASGRPHPYGFGWFVDSLRGQVVHQHGGSWQGFRTQYTHYVADDVGVVVLTNIGTADPVAIANAVAAAVSPSLAAEPAPNAPIADRDPQATAYVRGVLEKTARGTIELKDFAFVRQTTFPRTKAAYGRMLAGLGAPDRLELLARAEVGDDRRLTYRAAYGTGGGARVFTVVASLAPEGGLTGLTIRPAEPAR